VRSCSYLRLSGGYFPGYWSPEWSSFFRITRGLCHHKKTFFLVGKVVVRPAVSIPGEKKATIIVIPHSLFIPRHYYSTGPLAPSSTHYHYHTTATATATPSHCCHYLQATLPLANHSRTALFPPSSNLAAAD
jgi:hypothetical protein